MFLVFFFFFSDFPSRKINLSDLWLNYKETTRIVYVMLWITFANYSQPNNREQIIFLVLKWLKC